MSSYQSPIIVRRRVTPARPQRIRSIATASDLAWLADLIINMHRPRTFHPHAYAPAPVPRPELVPGLCAEIECGDCCVCLEEVERSCVRRFGCGHETCMSCYSHIYGTTARCPLCRAEIKHVMRAPEKKIIRIHKKKWCVYVYVYLGRDVVFFTHRKKRVCFLLFLYCCYLRRHTTERMGLGLAFGGERLGPDLW